MLRAPCRLKLQSGDIDIIWIVIDGHYLSIVSASGHLSYFLGSRDVGRGIKMLLLNIIAPGQFSVNSFKAESVIMSVELLDVLTLSWNG